MFKTPEAFLQNVLNITRHIIKLILASPSAVHIHSFYVSDRIKLNLQNLYPLSI